MARIAVTQDDIARAVLYTGNRYPGGVKERGVVTSFNDHAVFVRYDGKQTSQATSYEDLEWEFPT